MVHDNTEMRERKKERKKERHLRQMKNEKMSCCTCIVSFDECMYSVIMKCLYACT